MMKFAVTTLLILASFASGRQWTSPPSDYIDYRKPDLAEYNANALTCYTCDSYTSPSGCKEDDFTPSVATQTTCTAGEVCMKGVVGDVVLRGCSIVEEGLKNNECQAVEEASLEICYCSTDLCNSALSNNPGLVLAFIVILAAKHL